MKKQKIAKDLLKVAKMLVASKDIQTLPMINQMQKIKLDFSQPQYTEQMKWEKQTDVVKTKLSDGRIWQDTITVYVYGYSNNQREQGVWLETQSIDPHNGKHKNLEYLKTVRFALNSSGGVDGYYDIDRIDYFEEEYSEQDWQKVAQHISTCNYITKKSIQKLSNKL